MCVNNATNNSTPTRWQQQQNVARRDFWAKNISAYALLLFNVFVLGGALYCIIQYCPLPTEALLASPFIGGVLVALVYLKVPTCGIKSGNYKNLVNPTHMLGLVSACLFFAPLMYALKCIDLTPYHDPITANLISDDISKEPLANIASSYGRHATHLVKYGFIPPDKREPFSTLCKQHEKASGAQQFWEQKKRQNSVQATKVQDKIKELQNEWATLQNSIKDNLPFPDEPDYESTSLSSRVERYLFSLSFHNFQPSHTSSRSTGTNVRTPTIKHQSIGTNPLDNPMSTTA
jgi:hypothetical protein